MKKYMVLAMFIAAFIIIPLALVTRDDTNASATQSSLNSVQSAAVNSAAIKRGLPDFTDLVEAVGPSVVNISTSQKPQTSKRRPHFGDRGAPFDDWLRRYFGDDEDMPRQFDAKSLGSGFILTSDGYIMTNHHVVKNADEIIVKFADRSELVAEIVGSDEKSDVAILKVDGKNLPVAKIGSSDKLRVGEWVLAIGSPFGFDYSATAGIVSAKGRSLPTENYVPFIQTDVAINPGNSGGPLFNLDGEVIGVNSQIFSRTGGFMGLSFAIPIDIAMDVSEQLKTKGKVVRGWLGVLIQPVTRELAESFGMKKPQGALVARVLPNSPAKDAGFKVGDVVISFNKQNIETNSDLPPIVGRTKVGKAVPVIVMRNGKKVKLKVTIGELPSDDEIRVARKSGGQSGGEIKKLGVRTGELTEEIRKELEFDKNGVVVIEVSKGPARRAGMRKGDVIVMVDGNKINNNKDLRKRLKSIPKGKSVPFLIHRKSGPVFLAIKF